MADITATSLDANLLKVYGQEVLLAYNETSKLKDKLMNRTITSGKSASFPTFTTETAKLHVAGESVFSATGDNASTISAGEKVITIEKLLYAAQFVDNLEEIKAHYDVRAALSAQAGAAMGKQHDAFLLAAMGQAATGAQIKEVAGTASGDGSAGILSTSAKIKETFEDAALALDLQNVPHEDRCMVVRPHEYYQILQEDSAISADFSTSGDRARGMQNLHYLGFEVIAMNLMNDYYDSSDANMTNDSGSPLYLGGVTHNDDHSFDGSRWFALAFHKGAAGTVTLKGLSSEANYIPERFGSLLSTSAGIGTGILRPEGVVKMIAAGD
tara:strand:- start:69 stop:1049 length:981 start_codon:yes stop_codon:yes gene_type:complete